MNWLMSMIGRPTNTNRMQQMIAKVPGLKMKRTSIPMIALGIGAIAYGMRKRKMNI